MFRFGLVVVLLIYGINVCITTHQDCTKTGYNLPVEKSCKADDHVKTLGLQPLVEGGFYRETYKSEHLSVIYFLLPFETFSAWHRVRHSDEVWSFHDGCPLAMHFIYVNETYERIELGSDRFSVSIPKDTWQAAETIGDCHSLVGNVVAPPFIWQNFEMPPLDELLKQFPKHEEILRRFTRQ
ncbi:uncharacterized protein LOC128549154 [Mercenaria mercenaria]|uniref:uncharacterized protein LOC128549154 n=1 Tax=Mercenaria mercenaria TaxID=6596 RepID=UPI00234F9047|nr:uncharacterized protein LOC128549154 [Mercenaria mercenaria]